MDSKHEAEIVDFHYEYFRRAVRVCMQAVDMQYLSAAQITVADLERQCMLIAHRVVSLPVNEKRQLNDIMESVVLQCKNWCTFSKRIPYQDAERAFQGVVPVLGELKKRADIMLIPRASRPVRR